MEIKSEADSNDITECSHDDKPSTGMFAVSNDIFSAVSCVYGELTSEAKMRGLTTLLQGSQQHVMVQDNGERPHVSLE